MKFTYDGNDNETYYIFYGERRFAEVFAAEDIVIVMVELLNNSNIEETIQCF